MRRLFAGLKFPSSKQTLTYFLLGCFVILVGTYFFYSAAKIFSPTSLLRFGNPRIEVKTSNTTSNGTPLVNNITSPDQPNYGGGNNTLMILQVNGNDFVLPRLQGEVWFQ